MKAWPIAILSVLPLPAIAAQCSVDATSVAFGSYDPFSPTPLDGVGGVHVRCDAPVSFSIALASGTGRADDRRLVSGSAFLRYGLYLDAARAAPWGDGTGGSNPLAGEGASVDYPVYGRIFAHQNQPVGQYADTVVVTLSF